MPVGPTDPLLHDLLARAEREVRKHSASLMRLRTGYPPGQDQQHVGTGVIVQIGPDYFLFTAAHVANALVKVHELGEPLCFCLGHEQFQLAQAPLAWSGPPLPRSDSDDAEDRIDAAVLKFIPESVAEADLATHSHQVERLLLSVGPTETGPWIIYGFPGESLRLQGASGLTDGSAFEPFFAQANRDLLSPHGGQDDMHVALAVNDIRAADGSPHPPWNARGLSGCGFWDLGVPWTDLGCWTPERTLLGAIAHTAYPSVSPYTHFVGCLPRAHLSLVYRHFPECRVAIDSAFPGFGPAL